VYLKRQVSANFEEEKWRRPALAAEKM